MPTLENRVIHIDQSYLDHNPNLVESLFANRYGAVDHYLSIGMQEGRTLGL